MGNLFLPKEIEKIKVPPIKCQGIKTKLVPFIAKSISWCGSGRWIEPFLGSGVVALNILPENAVLSDSNKYIIKLYNDLQHNKLNVEIIKETLENHNTKLSNYGSEYYYEIRNRFNEKPNSTDFLFLNRSCFNGLMRFNKSGQFNVPFGHKCNRFRKAYITKIINQVKWISEVLLKRNWILKCQNWEDTLSDIQTSDFVYLDPPYIGRNTDYFNNWNIEDAEKLFNRIKDISCGFALSMWLRNKYRENEYVIKYLKDYDIKKIEHFYHLGSSENLRNSMMEALFIKKGYASN